MRKIKKYTNRKLYHEGKYITLSSIMAMLKNNEEVVIVDHDSGLDVTNDVLKQMIVKANIPKSALLNMLRNSAEDSTCQPS
jgi:polyhydroxyalkanoate synthesis regulator protein